MAPRSCFNPRAREGATAATFEKLGVIPVSIHAPVRARHLRTVAHLVHPCFNPRAREGATPALRRQVVATIVSIHAPVRARRWLLHHMPHPRVSIHAPVRARLGYAVNTVTTYQFQSTRP